MHPNTYDNLNQAEQSHWWFRHRRALSREFLRRVGRHPGGVALDIGSGTGGNLSLLGESHGHVVGFELSEHAVSLCAAKNPHAAIVRADANDLARTVAPSSIDLVSLFNVLYHSWVVDDLALLKSAHRILRPGGHLIVCEAAFESLRRQRDRLDHGARRYRLAPLLDRIEKAGFTIERKSYFNAIGFPVAWFLARLDHWTGSYSRPLSEHQSDRDLDVSRAWIQRLAFAVSGLERVWMRLGGRVPFGINILIVARKNGSDQVRT
jgi:SAM-dependent methyltransferase